MKRICEKTQYAIAIGQPVDQRGQSHLDTCELCQTVRDEYLALQLIVSSIEIHLPLDFTDNVMGKIDAFENQKADPWGRRWAIRMNALVTGPKLQYLGLGVAGGVSLVSLLRFALYVLVPG